MSNSVPTERAALVGIIDADAYGAGTYTTTFVKAGLYRRLMAVIAPGDFVSTGVLNAKLRRATDSSGTSAEDITGAAITQMTEAGGKSNKQAIINYDLQNEAGNAKNYIGLSVTLTTAGADLTALLLGFDPLNKPASDNDLASVDEIVTVQ